MNGTLATTSKKEETYATVELSEEVDTKGFDIQAGQTWVYPTNYALRDYQYNIIQGALLKNTMVSLPTGLGKTFIAAVVMYNFYRWYPESKIIFMAPTRPLVKQQIEACYNIMAIPKEVTAELTGTKIQISRKEIWKEKRVFFATPQVLQNDLNIVSELGTKIKCLVFDEAHKAKGNHAYCEVIRRLYPKNKYFRVLALSATPGSTLNDVLEVIRNLMISNLEIRTDDSPDVVPYTFQRSLETVVVPLDGKLQQVRDDYIKILEKFTKILIEYKIITGNCSMLTKGKIFMTMKDYQERCNKNGRDRAYPEIMRNLNICVTLYHAYELLVRHGLRGFLSFFEEHAEKPLLRGNTELRRIMHDVQEYLGPIPNIEPLPDGSIMEIPESTKFGHPKYYKLVDILSDHFARGSGSATRVIVFCEYRESVMEAYALLLRHKPLITPKIFLGQGAITQKQQINVVNAFRNGECNTLISTCIGEEGLDVGEVDLIVCFDINNKSPVRMIQRMGRTGRKREGRVVILVTEGKEQQTLKECLIHKQNLTNHILQSSALYKEMYSQNPRMVPTDIEPKCHKMFITVKSQSKSKKVGNLKNMLNSASSKNFSSNLYIQDCNEDLPLVDRIPIRQEYWDKDDPVNIPKNNFEIDFSSKLGKLRILQPVGDVGHSKNSEMLVSLLQLVDSKKYSIPSTQQIVSCTQSSQPVKLTRQMDIRNMFIPSSTKLLVKDRDTELSKEIKCNRGILNELLLEVESYLESQKSDDNYCKICENLCDCSKFQTINDKSEIAPWNELDISIVDNLTEESLTLYTNSLDVTPTKLDVIEVKGTNCDAKSNVESKNDVLLIDIVNESFFNDTFELKDSPFKPPQNLGRILNKCGLPVDFNNSALTHTTVAHAKNQLKSSSTNKDIPFNSTNTKIVQLNTYSDILKTYQDTLQFFKMNESYEIFENISDTSTNELPKSPMQLLPNCSSQDTIMYSPSEHTNLSEEKNKETEKEIDNGSPVIRSYEKLQQFKQKIQKRRLFDSTCEIQSDNDNKRSKSEQIEHVEQRNANVKCLYYSSDDDIFDESPAKVAKVSKPNLSNTEIVKDASPKLEKRNNSVNASDLIDTSINGSFENVAVTQIAMRKLASNKSALNTSNTKKTNLDITDVIDLSALGLDGINIANNHLVDNKKTSKIKSPHGTCGENFITHNDLADTHLKKSNAIVNINDLLDESLLTMLFEDDSFSVNKEKENKSDILNLNSEEENNKNMQNLLENNCIRNENETYSPKKENGTTQNSLLNHKHDGSSRRSDYIGTAHYDKGSAAEVIDLTENDVDELSPSLMKSQYFRPSQKSQIDDASTQQKNNKINCNANSIQSQLTKKNSKKNSSLCKSVKSKLDFKQKEDADSGALMQWIKKQSQPSTSCNKMLSNCSNSPTKISNSSSCQKTNSLLQGTQKGIGINANNILKSGKTENTAVLSSIINSDSDDDFETTKSVAWIKSKPKIQNTVRPSKNKKVAVSTSVNKKSKKRSSTKQIECEFIDLEADVTHDQILSYSEDDESDNDAFEESFVDDNTQLIPNATIMHAHYMQSVRSPILNSGKFKIPDRPLHNTTNVYSQMDTETENTYVNDTFCVSSEDEEAPTQNEMSDLEVAELILEKEYKKRKKHKLSTKWIPKVKKAKTIEISSDSD